MLWLLTAKAGWQNIPNHSYLCHDQLLAVLPGLPLRPRVERDPRVLLLRQTVNLGCMKTLFTQVFIS